MNERLRLPLARPPRLFAANPGSIHGADLRPEAYRLRRIWCLNLYRGSGELMWRGQRQTIRPGSISLTAPDTDHSYSYRGDAVLTWLHFLPDPSGRVALVPLMQAVGMPAFAVLLAQAQAAACCWRDQPERAQALLWGLLWQLADSVVPQASAVPNPVVRAMAHVDERLGDPLTAGDLARAAGCSVTHLNRLFRSVHGCAAMGWLRRRRLERAQHLLHCSTLPAARIAGELGFVDLQHLSKALRRATGRGPRVLRAEGGIAPETAEAGHEVLDAKLMYETPRHDHKMR